MNSISNVAAGVAKNVGTITMNGRYIERLAKWHELGRFGKALGTLYAPVRACCGVAPGICRYWNQTTYTICSARKNSLETSSAILRAILGCTCMMKSVSVDQ
jgi:hypothetical protein